MTFDIYYFILIFDHVKKSSRKILQQILASGQMINFVNCFIVESVTLSLLKFFYYQTWYVILYIDLCVNTLIFHY